MEEDAFEFSHYLGQSSIDNFSQWVYDTPSHVPAMSPAFEWSPFLRGHMGYRYSLGDYNDMMEVDPAAGQTGMNLGQGSGTAGVDPSDLVRVDEDAGQHYPVRTPSSLLSREAFHPALFPADTPLRVVTINDIIALQQSLVDKEDIFVPSQDQKAFANFALPAPPPARISFHVTGPVSPSPAMQRIRTEIVNPPAPLSPVRHIKLSVDMPENVKVIGENNVVERLAYKVQQAEGRIRTFAWEEMTERFFDAEMRINEYWPNTFINWQGKLNIQSHVAKVKDYDN
ncbi:hypothetical protein QFC21_007181 [Naganishia friedmannii]|uniref:Uncharacterized protein n=1 Tax=Naganishia friedmannii TaxID=89922 RepID=A0ACC2UYK2_9TREE|nr:hypothetical protein QFC21_007181 [Naganishia friedmannii]